MSEITAWIGRSERYEDILRAEPARFMEATLGHSPTLQQGDALPPLWHWLYFLEAKPISELGRDGHPQKGQFLPPVSLPRRMWAGGRVRFHAPLRIGASVKKRSTIKCISEKKGRSGALCFVSILHELFKKDGSRLITEEQDIVYREDPAIGAPEAALTDAPTNAEVSECIQPSAVMLFRYSALTFNGHRVHYDVDYAREVEGYDGLVFHGPLAATLLAGLAERVAGVKPVSFEYRGVAPLSNLQNFWIEARQEGSEVKLWAKRHDGALAMRARAMF